MAYADEEILLKREQAKMETYTTLEKGIYMDGEIIHFKRKELFDTFSIMLPESWKQMPKEYARIKYPSEFRPQIIITTLDLSVNLGFTVFPTAVQSDNPDTMAERVRAAIYRSNPNFLMYPCENLEEASGCWFGFRSHAMDSDLYNMMLLTIAGKRLVQASFNCPYKDYIKWKKVTLKIWKSIIELKEGIWK